MGSDRAVIGHPLGPHHNCWSYLANFLGLFNSASASSILAVKLPRWAVLHAGEGLEQTGIGYSLDRRCIWHHDPPCRQYPLEEDCRTAEEGYYCQIWTSIGSWMLRGVAIQVMTFIFLFFLMLARATPRHARKVLFALLLVNCLILLFVLDFFVSLLSCKLSAFPWIAC